MSVYIRGMEMPNCGLTVTIYPDGKVVQFLGYGEKKQLGTAIPVPDHGRLISAKRIEFELCESNMPKTYREFCRRVIRSEDLSPTIIPADNKEVKWNEWNTFAPAKMEDGE